MQKTEGLYAHKERLKINKGLKKISVEDMTCFL